jgi:HlyD family secretion protein
VSKAKKILLAVVALCVIGAIAGAAWWYRRSDAPTVTFETVRLRDLEAVVSASGKIQPKRLVNISADTSGRVVDLAVNEGDRVKQGQFLMQIDPRSLRTRVESGQAALQGAEAALDQARQSVETARSQLTLAEQNLKRQRELWAAQLTTRESMDRAENDVRVAQSTLVEREKQVRTQELRLGQDRAALDNARYDLSKVRIESPIDGIVTRRNIQAGETAVVGTMNNAGTVLLTIADMSIIQAEVEVDETNIPSIAIGQPAVITIDAMPERRLKGHVAEIGNSPIQAAGQQTGATAGQQATNFKVIVVLDEPIPDARPGFTCTADITTATRKQALAVPIQAVAVRELIYDSAGKMVPQQPRPRAGTPTTTPVVPELEPGQTRKETEGVFVLRDRNITEFVLIKIGIAGESYFELLSGLKEGDRVITGPYTAMRQIVSGDDVKTDTPTNSAR